jgi:tRNA (mo5U34)-methyltransferase
VSDRTVEEAQSFIANSSFVWHQRFELLPGVVTPGVSDVNYLAELAALPQDLTGRRVLDVGTSNGGTALECERRGADHVVAVDVVPPDVHGIEQILRFVDSKVRYVRASVYELDTVLDEPFDIVIFWGVLYHLRHPLLALDTLRKVCAGTLSVETAVDGDHEHTVRGTTMVRFFRAGELGDDPSNWFAPTVPTLEAWLRSAGFTPVRLEVWPEPVPSRALVNATVTGGVPEYLQLSYEHPLRVSTSSDWDGPRDELPFVADTDDGALPLPPIEMRVLVGPTDPSAFDNPRGALVFPSVTTDQYESVVDFGCGCGRIARQLIQQEPRPRRYVGLDLHRGMIDWCRANLTPRAPGFEFLHHDVHEQGFNPGPGKPDWAPFSVADESCSLFVAISVFTHLLQHHAVGYLRELRRVLRPGGIAITSWFFFDKRSFPMMQDDQNTLFINPVHPTNAVIFDRAWLERTLADAGLVASAVEPPAVRGFQWTVHLVRDDTGITGVEFGCDEAPFGIVRAGSGIVDPHLIGTSGAHAQVPRPS